MLRTARPKPALGTRVLERIRSRGTGRAPGNNAPFIGDARLRQVRHGRRECGPVPDAGMCERGLCRKRRIKALASLHHLERVFGVEAVRMDHDVERAQTVYAG